jgi:ABC-type histidine transport system ATPase subunit
MLFDEPTSALDPELVGEVLKVIRDLADEGRTMILVTHEMKFAREVSSKVIFLANGLIEEQGDPKEVFANPKSERLRQFLKSVS